ncbi:sensor histidine kinase [Mucilaginibacter flavus]|uniref:sensor histidine kinase n=1 Tax=Mucilaginibacter flavus TaxID=931504 RepID=UPI0025B52F45|nr:sensor histidine kinase [Mucilaginibacter flavus]
MLFITYEVLLGFTAQGRVISAFTFAEYAAHYAVNICFFYVHGYLTYPLVANRKTPGRYFLILLLIAVEFVVYVGAMKFVAYLLYEINDPKFIFLNVYYWGYLWRFIYFMLIGTAIYYTRTAFKHETRIVILENERINNLLDQQLLENKLIKSENAWRQSQLNPHFLFNTLNLIYNKVSVLSPEIGDSIIKLSEIMRFSITPLSNSGKIKLEDEIEHIRLFINLNQLRFNDKLALNFEVTGEEEGLMINPLLLITLVENVFKYGDLYNQEDPASIIINITGSILSFNTRNHIKKRKVSSHGIGLANVTEQLKTYYPNQFEFLYEERDSVFDLSLTINLAADDQVLLN